MLGRVAAGDFAARDELWRRVYEDLREIARRQLSRGSSERTLRPTELVHEVYLKLDKPDAAWSNRRHFFHASARAMRQILVDHARGRRTRTEVGDLVIELDDDSEVGIEELDGALRALEAQPDCKRQARVVELRYFAGLSIEETAQVLATSPATVKRDWDFARAWLRRRMRRADVP